MSKASLSNGNGPGSSIALAPETIRIRDALIEKFNGAPLEEMNNFMTIALSNETDELRRLGILAARIYILRNRMANLKEFNRNPSLTSLPALDTTTLSLNLPGTTEPIMTDVGEATSEADQWSRIQMIEPGEVNGVRFLAGTIIDAQSQDADKLIHSGKAVRVDIDGNIIDHHDDDFHDSNNPAADSNNPAADSDDTAQAIDDDASAQTEPNDAPESDEPQGASDAEVDADADAEVDAEAEANGGESQMADIADKDPKVPTS